MFDESGFLNQVNPLTVQAELKRLRDLKLIDQVAFLELTALSVTKFNPSTAFNTLRTYLSAASRCKVSPNKVNQYFALQERIYQDLGRNFNSILLAWNERDIELDADNHPPIVVADNLTQYLIREPIEVENVLKRLTSQLSN